MERSVAADPERPRIARHGVADELRPRRRDLGERERVAAAAPRQLALDLAADALHQLTRPGSTASTWAGSLGKAAAAVAVTIA